jgi:hypothetical protein
MAYLTSQLADVRGLCEIFDEVVKSLKSTLWRASSSGDALESWMGIKIPIQLLPRPSQQYHNTSKHTMAAFDSILALVEGNSR